MHVATLGGQRPAPGFQSLILESWSPPEETMFIYQQRWRLKKKPGLEPRDNGRNKRPNKQKIKPLASLQQTKSTKRPPEQLIANTTGVCRNQQSWKKPGSSAAGSRELLAPPTRHCSLSPLGSWAILLSFVGAPNSSSCWWGSFGACRSPWKQTATGRRTCFPSGNRYPAQAPTQRNPEQPEGVSGFVREAH